MSLHSARKNRYGDLRDEFPGFPSYGAAPPPGLTYQMSGCGIAGCIDTSGGSISGDEIAKMLTIMSERENGLGSGYVCYGLFPENRDDYCLQFMFDNEDARSQVEEHLKDRGEIVKDEKIFTKSSSTMKPPYPMLWRYFFDPDPGSDRFRVKGMSNDDAIVEIVMGINGRIPGAICCSSGKDMAVFKGNGFSYEIADYYDISRYKGQMWLSHSRFPTNTPGWWAGAHPISLLDWSICHNGEITSYGVNKKFVEMAGYKCSLLTDTEVITYLWDLLVRKHRLPIQVAAFAMAPWYHADIDRLDDKSRKLADQLRVTYKEAFLNGPFSILVGRSRPETTMIAMADRKKLRPLIIGESASKKIAYAASEECAIRVVDDSADTWVTPPGSPMIAKVGQGIIRRGNEHPFKGVTC